MHLNSLITPYINNASQTAIKLREIIHKNPELGHQEYKTTEIIVDFFKTIKNDLSSEIKDCINIKPLPNTGLIVDIMPVLLEGADKNSTFIALRADIDALPLNEETNLSCKSLSKGLMHGCGHDIHTACLIGAGTILIQLLKNGQLQQKVRLIFQPSEEMSPSGALEVIENGGMEGVSEIYAQHVEPKLDVGKIGIKTGPITSAVSLLEVTLSGKGGHTARPHLSSDIISALSFIALNSPVIVSRKFDPKLSANLSWGQISAGNSHNAIPDKAYLQGTFRTLDPFVFDKANEIVPEVIKNLASPFLTNLNGDKLKIEINYHQGVPPVVNTMKGVHKIRQVCADIVSESSVSEVPQSLGAEDFSFYLNHKTKNATPEGAMLRLGTHSYDIPGAKRFDIHQPDFEPDIRCIDIGIKVLVGLALK